MRREILILILAILSGCVLENVVAQTTNYITDTGMPGLNNIMNNSMNNILNNLVGNGSQSGNGSLNNILNNLYGNGSQSGNGSWNNIFNNLYGNGSLNNILNNLFGNGSQSGITNLTVIINTFLLDIIPTPQFVNPGALQQGPSADLLANIASQPVNSTNILSFLTQNPTLSLGSLYKPTQLAQMAPSDVVNLLGGTSQSIDFASAQALGPLLPISTSFAQAAKVMSAAPIEIMNQQNASTLIASIANVDFSNMDVSRQSAFAAKILEAPTAANLQSYVAAVPANMINNIPAASFFSSGLSPFSLPAAQVPNSVAFQTATTQLASAGSLSNLLSSANSSVLALVSSALPPSQLSTISSPSSIVSLMTAASSGKGLSSLQRKTLGPKLISSASSLSSLTTAQLNATAELFIEQSNSVLSNIPNAIFGTILGVVSQYPVTKCQNYAYSARQTFATAAANYLLSVNNRAALTHDDLVSLGPCFASAISVNHFTSMNYTDFYLGSSYFQGIQFQPNSTYITNIQSKLGFITAVKKNITAVVANMGELSIFLPSLSTIDNKTMTSYANSISTVLKSSKNLNNATVQLNRVGVSDTATSGTISSFISAWQSNYVNYLIQTNSSSRRKRSTYIANSITCSQLTSGPPYAFSADYLGGISSSVFKSCMSVLGATTNTYTTAQINALASVAISNSLYNSDTYIQSLGVILTGFTEAQLAGLQFSQDNTISKLGAINSWSSTQINALLTAMSNNAISITSKLSISGNLICGYNSTTVSSISSSTILSSMSVLKTLSNPNCASLSSLYSAVKSANNVTTLSASNLADFSGLIGGAPSTDLTGLGESFASITSTGIANLPASTINALPTTLFSYLTTSQLASFQNSPYYSGFSSSVTSVLSSAAAGTSTTTTSSSDSNVVKFNLASLIFSSLMALFVFKLN